VTTQISLVREHTEKLNPPRALWVPFELGRPIGAPDEPAFQRRVVEAALALFAESDGPVLAEFPDDAPGGSSGDMSGWVCPVNLMPPAEDAAPDGALAAVLAEMDQLRPWYQVALEKRGRTTVGLSGLEIGAVAKLLADFLDDQSIASPREDIALPQALKFASDDIKAWYFEAATAQPGPSGSVALNDWYWQDTAAGAMVRRLAATCRTLDGGMMQLLGHKALVPRTHEHLVQEI
jgi:hypothetical protein